MKTVLEVLNLSADYLKQKGISHFRREAEDLIAGGLKLKRLQLYLEFDRPVLESELAICREFLTRRVKKEPTQYILGEVEFHGCQIKVGPHVLIPRQETEILVDKIIQQLASQDLKGKILWDVCCGSGCLGISLKKRFPELTVILADISHEALAVAKENCLLNGVEIECRQGDLLLPFAGEKADFFVCNPPYVSEGEYMDLEEEVRCHEPKEALIGGRDGLQFYRRLAQDLKSHLNPGGQGWFEIGKGQGEAIIELFKGSPWKNCKVESDWSGHDRFFFLEIE